MEKISTVTKGYLLNYFPFIVYQETITRNVRPMLRLCFRQIYF